MNDILTAFLSGCEDTSDVLGISELHPANIDKKTSAATQSNFFIFFLLFCHNVENIF